MAIIRIQDLKVEAIVGIHDYEREKPQPVAINIEVDYNIEKAIKTDNINQALDYEKICQSIIDQVKSSQFYLIETLAAYILDIIMKDTKIRKGLVRVVKPKAIGAARAVEIELERTR